MATNKYDITDLLSLKSFEELTTAEQAFAIDELGSETAYREMYEVVQGTADYKAPKLTAAKRDRTFAAFDELHAEKPSKKRSLIWLKPVIIGLAAASVIGFVWLIGFSDIGKNQTLAENKSPVKTEAKDSIVEKVSSDKRQDLEQEKNEAEPPSARAVEEENLDQENLLTKPTASVKEEKALIAEESDIPQPALAEDEALPENASIAFSEIEADEELAEDEMNLGDMATDSYISANEVEAAQPATKLESTVVSHDRSERTSKSAINMNSNISKQSIFKLTLPLRNHYTSY